MLKGFIRIQNKQFMFKWACSKPPIIFYIFWVRLGKVRLVLKDRLGQVVEDNHAKQKKGFFTKMHFLVLPEFHCHLQS